ncbi:glutaredoxin family protein [Geoalkalibacter halelectricus]|uniref:Thioredoxin domain-containing protein n=1 Tax=Geoalkalibacter halelectricus TaxID=2847045 RepID=A0ABY5ZT13_9BACT|nr:hypothetical protein [Geoalkalibacter halelectricus]MDO3379247.1 hypothetical protein [Geoalkalibacter halelectricus]UWZ81005.1 hypothetical protein L9S41_06315 [Geoalkalibacter halelectricus]
MTGWLWRLLLVVVGSFWQLTDVAGAVAQVTDATEQPGLVLRVYSAENCPHCRQAEEYLKGLAAQYPSLHIDIRDIWIHRDNFVELVRLADIFDAPVTTPSIFLADRAWFGFGPAQGRQIEAAIRECLREGCPDTLELEAAGMLRPRPWAVTEEDDAEGTSLFIPWVGRVDGRALSLPVFTLVIGLLDSFNPCAFFVLLFLLSLLVHLRSRARMLLVGGIFIFFSGLFYFLFMAAWLNLFLSFGQLRGFTLAAGVLAVLMGGINIKDFFFFKQGLSLSLPESAKPRLFQRMRGLLRASSLGAMIGATIVLAAAANLYELLCTAGFPMIYTRVLTLHELPVWQYYLFLSMYNLVYVVPLVVILVVFAWTLGAAKLSEWHGRVLKLLSGTMMLLLGAVLLARPLWLHQMLVSVGLLAVALLLTWLVSRRWRPDAAGRAS